MSTIKYTYRFRIEPNKEQRKHLARTFGCSRYVYNWAVEERTNAYHGEAENLSFATLSRRLTQLKKQEATKWLGEVSAVTLQQSLRNLERAFTNFFEGRAQYPSFKRKRGKQSARYVGTAFDIRKGESANAKLRLSKMPGLIKVRWSRSMEGPPSSCTVTRDPAGRYHVCFLCDVEIDHLPPGANAVGIDLGITRVVVTSDGEKIGNPRFLEQEYRKLRREQKKLSRKEKGSHNWERQRQRVARIHARIKDRRDDFLHKLTTHLVRRTGVITVEALAVKNMQQNRHLSRAIGQIGWSELVRQLEYKCEWYGKALVKANRWFPSSKRCSECRHVEENMPLSKRMWECPECRSHHDRDVNAAKNLRRVGHTRTFSERR